MDNQNQATTSTTLPVSNPTPEVHPLENKKPVVLIVLVILLILSLIGIAFLIFQNMSLQKQIAAMKTVSYTSPTTTPTSTPNNNIYTNTALKFSFNLPAGYQLISESSDKITFGTPASLSDPTLVTYLTIYPAYREDYSTLPECTETGQPQFPCRALQTVAQSKTTIKVDNKDAKNYYIDKGTVDSLYRIVQVGNLELEMNISGGGLDTTFDQILSTFKFTN